MAAGDKKWQGVFERWYDRVGEILLGVAVLLASLLGDGRCGEGMKGLSQLTRGDRGPRRRNIVVRYRSVGCEASQGIVPYRGTLCQAKT